VYPKYQNSPSSTGKVVRLSPREVDFSSLSGAKKIHSYNRPFIKSSMYKTLVPSNGIASVFSTRDPVYHARHRRLLSAPMSEASLKNIEHLVQVRGDLVVEKLGQEMKRYGVADVLKWWMFYSTDIIGELTFGESFRMLEHGQVRCRYLP
jgi:cytochrome P450